MSEPHLPSDDQAIAAAQAGIRPNLEARARKLVDAALSEPSLSNIRAVTAVLETIQHHRWAEIREPRPRDELDDLHDTYHAEYTRSQAGFAANPAPAMGERGERMVPRRRE